MQMAGVEETVAVIDQAEAEEAVAEEEATGEEEVEEED